jgi:Tfp pilus assembly protein PilN
MSQVNLLPPEIRQRQQLRRLTVVIALGGLLVLALIMLFYLVQVGTLGGIQDDIRAQERNNQTIRNEIAELQQFEDLQAEAQAKQALLDAAYRGEVSFSGLLMDVSQVIPGNAVLTSLTSQLADLSTEPEPGSPVFAGSISAGGQALDLDTIAEWLTRLESVDGWENPWLNGASQSQDVGFTFTSGVDLTTDVLTRRGRQGVEGG